MKKQKILLNGLVVLGLLFGGASHGQNILVMVEGGHDGEARTRAFGNWVLSEIAGSTVSFSADLAIDLLATPSDSPFSTDQMNLANSFDFIIFPRHGTGGSGNYGSKDWNNVTSHVITMNPFTGRAGNWAWHTDDASPVGDGNITVTDLTVDDPGNSIFSGVDTSGGEVTMFTSGQSTLTPLLDHNDFTGNVVARHSLEDNEHRVWIVQWDGSEGSYFVGGSEGPAGPRTFFGSNVNGPGPLWNAVDEEWNAENTVWTPEAQQMFLNTIPEPSTYALIFGFAALGGALIWRRIVRRADR